MSNPTTPHRRLSTARSRHLHRSSGVYALLPQSPKVHYPIDPENLPLDSPTNTENFELLSDAVQDLELHMKQLQQIHQSITRGFNESFASFLYGLSITMWCVDFQSSPSKDLEQELQVSKHLDDNIQNLEARIEEAKKRNVALKVKLQNKQRQKPSVLRPKPIGNKRKLEDSFSSDSSYGLKSRIPIKARSYQSNYMSRKPASQVGKVSQANRGTLTLRLMLTPSLALALAVTPNLNQPPRYLDGLFSSTKQKKPTRIQDRPPFR